MAEIPDGWPCALLSATPPSIADRQSGPSPDDLLPQILALTPRGPAWGTDEAGDGSGASPVQRSVWRAIAAWAADVGARDFEAASQCFPSAITASLPTWEAELGLPDECGAPAGEPGRILAVRARFGAIGGSSPAYFVCLAASAGYAVTIEEPTQFLVDVSELIGPDLVEGWFVPDDSVCDGGTIGEGYFRPDDGECDGDPLETFTAALSGDGDSLEVFVLGAASGPGDEVAGRAPIETFFACDDAECDGEPVEGFTLDDPAGSIWKSWVVHLPSGGDTFFVCDDGECEGTPLEGFVDAPRLECLVRRATPPHTQVVFAYDG